MILPVALLVVAAAMMMTAPRVINNDFGGGRHPRGELVAWQVATWSAVLCTISALTVLAVPWASDATSLPQLLERCLRQAGSSDSTWLPLAARIAVGVVLFLVVGRLIATVALQSRRHRIQRLWHRRTLDMVASRDAVRDRWTVRSDVAMVYCVPGRCARVVFTSEALRRLDDAEQDAVCAHERAHLRCKHHRLVSSANLLASAFPGVELFARAERRTRSLVEVHADQVAARTVSPFALMSALLHLADNPTQPWPALNAAGVETTERVSFLVSQVQGAKPDPQLRRRPQRSWLLNIVMLTAVATAPLVLSAVIHAAFCWV